MKRAWRYTAFLSVFASSNYIEYIMCMKSEKCDTLVSPGKSSSVPLSLLCTDWDGQNRVHDFLSDYDELITFAKQAAEKQASGPSADGGGYGMLIQYLYNSVVIWL